MVQRRINRRRGKRFNFSRLSIEFINGFSFFNRRNWLCGFNLIKEIELFNSLGIAGEKFLNSLILFNGLNFGFKLSVGFYLSKFFRN